MIFGDVLKSVYALSLLILTCLVGCYSPPQISPLAAPDGSYVLDPAHASVVWSVKHAGLSNYTARFDKVSGALTFDSENPENSRVDIRIDPSSVSTGDSDFDDEIATKFSYFDANTFPQIRFVSTDILKTGNNTGEISGDLTFRGTTLPVTLDTIFNGAGKSIGHKGKTLGFSAKSRIKRSGFGMDNLFAFGVGDEVSVVIEAEFNEK